MRKGKRETLPTPAAAQLTMDQFVTQSRPGRGRRAAECRLCQVRKRAPTIYREVLRGWAGGMRGHILARYLQACGLKSMTTNAVDYHFGQGHHRCDDMPEETRSLDPIVAELDELERVAGGGS